MKNFKEQLEVLRKTKSLSTRAQFRKFLKNKKIKILNRTGNHNYGPTGTIINLTNIPENFIVNAGSFSYLKRGGNNLTFTNFIVLNLEETLSDLLNQIKNEKEELKKVTKEIKNNIKTLESKISYMEETGSEIFNEDEFKVYNTLSLLEEKNLSKIEKAKAIASLINS